MRCQNNTNYLLHQICHRGPYCHNLLFDRLRKRRRSRWKGSARRRRPLRSGLSVGSRDLCPVPVLGASVRTPSAPVKTPFPLRYLLSFCHQTWQEVLLIYINRENCRSTRTHSVPCRGTRWADLSQADTCGPPHPPSEADDFVADRRLPQFRGRISFSSFRDLELKTID